EEIQIAHIEHDATARPVECRPKKKTSDVELPSLTGHPASRAGRCGAELHGAVQLHVFTDETERAPVRTTTASHVDEAEGCDSERRIVCDAGDRKRLTGCGCRCDLAARADRYQIEPARGNESTPGESLRTADERERVAGRNVELRSAGNRDAAR